MMLRGPVAALTKSEDHAGATSNRSSALVRFARLPSTGGYGQRRPLEPGVAAKKNLHTILASMEDGVLGGPGTVVRLGNPASEARVTSDPWSERVARAAKDF